MRWFIGLLFFILVAANAAEITVKLYRTDTEVQPHKVGTVTAIDTTYGLLLKPNLYTLPPGLHGFHLHVNPSCADAGKAAGPHWDPKKTGQHLGPYNNQGHLGDLPALFVNPAGLATLPVLVPRLKVDDLRGHAFVIHAEGDNYADTPYANGGGGARIVCGVIDR